MIEAPRSRNSSLNVREANEVINFLGGESSQTRSFYKNVVSSNLDDEITSLSAHLKDLMSQKEYKLSRQKKLMGEKSRNIIQRFRSASENLSSLYIALADRLSQLDYLNSLNIFFLEYVYSPQEKQRVHMNKNYQKQMKRRKTKYIKDKVDYYFRYGISQERNIIPDSSSSSSSEEEGVEKSLRIKMLKKKQKKKIKRNKKRKELKFQGWNELTYDFSSIPLKKERTRLKNRVKNYFQPSQDEFETRKKKYEKVSNKAMKSQIQQMVVGERIMLEQHFSKEFLKNFRKKVHLLDFVNDMLGMDRSELDTLLTQSKITEFKTEIGIFDTEMIELRKEYQFLYWKYLKNLKIFKELKIECHRNLKEEIKKTEIVKKRVFEDVKGRFEYLNEQELESKEKYNKKEKELMDLLNKIKGVEDKIERNKKEINSMKIINKELEESKIEIVEELDLLKSKYNLLTKEKELKTAKKYIIDREKELKNFNNRLLGNLIYLNDLKFIYLKSLEIYKHSEPYQFSKNELFFEKKLNTLNNTLSQSITNSISSLSFFKSIQHLQRKISGVDVDEELRDKQNTRYVAKMKKKFYKSLKKTIDFNGHEKLKIQEIIRSTSQIQWFLFSLTECLENVENYKNDGDLEEHINVLRNENTKKAFNIQRLISFHRYSQENFVSSLTKAILNNLKKEGNNKYESPFEHVVRKNFILEDLFLTDRNKRIKQIQIYDKMRRNIILDRKMDKLRERKRRNVVKRVEKTLQDFLTKQN